MGRGGQAPGGSVGGEGPTVGEGASRHIDGDGEPGIYERESFYLIYLLTISKFMYS